jgi:hypothetical protein
MSTFTVNGSDTDWLVYADYLEDQDIDAAHIREGVAETQSNQWIFEYRYFSDSVGGDDIRLPEVVGSVCFVHRSTRPRGMSGVGCDNGFIGDSVGSGQTEFEMPQ